MASFCLVFSRVLVEVSVILSYNYILVYIVNIIYKSDNNNLSDGKECFLSDGLFYPVIGNICPTFTESISRGRLSDENIYVADLALTDYATSSINGGGFLLKMRHPSFDKSFATYSFSVLFPIGILRYKVIVQLFCINIS